MWGMSLLIFGVQQVPGILNAKTKLLLTVFLSAGWLKYIQSCHTFNQPLAKSLPGVGSSWFLVAMPLDWQMAPP